jgi:hypothetical protein
VPAARAENITFEQWLAVFCAQITQTISIITACFLQLKPFFSSLKSGLLQNDEGRRRHRQDSRSAFGYLSLSHDSAATRNQSACKASNLQALAGGNMHESSPNSHNLWNTYGKKPLE